MSELRALIANAIRSATSREEREQTYARSRQALLKAFAQMRADDPSFDAGKISEKLAELEFVISELEREMETERHVQPHDPASRSPELRSPDSFEAKEKAVPFSESRETAGRGATAPPTSAAPVQEYVAPGPPEPINRPAITPAAAPPIDEARAKNPIIRLNTYLLPAGGLALALFLAVGAWLALRPASQAVSASTAKLFVSAPPASPNDQQQIAGSATWTLMRATDGSEELQIEAAFGGASTADKVTRIRLTMSRMPANSPASHRIDCRFTAADGALSAVETMPGILIRDTGDETGKLLLGLAAREKTGQFVVALSSVASDVTYNRETLKHAKFIEIPFAGAAGGSSIASIEVGTGGAVLNQFLASWKQ